jgi:hypothetical protein
MKTDLVRLLTEMGYAPFTLKDRVVSIAALNALSVLGNAFVRAILHHMSSRTGLRGELLSNYAEFENALRMILGLGANVILKRFNRELAKNVHAHNLGLDDTFQEISKNEPAVFVRNMTRGEHVLLLYSSQGFRDMVISSFFDSLSGGNETKAAVLASAAPFPSSVIAITYQQLQHSYGLTAVNQKIEEWASAIRAGDARLRLAKDNTWLVENGLEEGPHDSERSPWSEATVLCAYDISKIGHERASKVVESHGFVVLEGSKSVYAKKPVTAA